MIYFGNKYMYRYFIITLNSRTSVNTTEIKYMSIHIQFEPEKVTKRKLKKFPWYRNGPAP